MNHLYFLVGLMLLSIGLSGLIPAFAQEVVVVPPSTPCWEDDEAGLSIWRDCGLGDDYLRTATLGFDWALGGYFAAVIAAVVMFAVWIKYQQTIYALLVGIAFLPATYFLFPESFTIFAMAMAAVAIGIIMWWMFIRQTQDS